MGMRCTICAGDDFEALYNGKIINGHRIYECRCCGMVVAFPVKEIVCDYTNYGDYLVSDRKAVRKRVVGMKKKIKREFKDLKTRYVNPIALDFGSGAGYFCKAAEEEGIKIYGVEKSEKLIEFCTREVNFVNVFRAVGQIDEMFDVIFMFDVIEHFDPLHSRSILQETLEHLKVNGLLIGQTPNFRSANVRLLKDKDPVVWPPYHVCYFTMDTLDRYLSSFGLQRKRLYSREMSSKGFLRKNKFEKSFAENGIRDIRIYLVPLALCIRAIFKCLGCTARVFRLGYQISFIYQKMA